MTIGGIILAVLISYLIGAVPWGYIIGKMNGIDIREHGSKNVGATNVTRVLGRKWGTLCFAIDFLKGFLPVIVFNLCIAPIVKISPTATAIYILLIILSTVLGHIFPVYISFKGGKGMSTAAGGLVAVSPLAVIIGGIVWIIIFKLSRYVSLASISAAVVVPVLTVFFSYSNIYTMPVTLQAMVVVLSVIVIIKHKSNIKRLMDGTENRFEKKKKE